MFIIRGTFFVSAYQVMVISDTNNLHCLFVHRVCDIVLSCIKMIYIQWSMHKFIMNMKTFIVVSLNAFILIEM